MQANNGVFVAWSDDGQNWSLGNVASHIYTGPSDTLTTPLKVPFDTLPDLAIDTNKYLPDGSNNPHFGWMYATWTRWYPVGQFPGHSKTKAGNDIMFAISTDGGQTWQTQTHGAISVIKDPQSGDNTTTKDGNGFSSISHVAVGPEGDVYVTENAGAAFAVFHSFDGNNFVTPDPTVESLHGYPFGYDTVAQPVPTLPDDNFRTLSARAIVVDPTHPGRVYAAEAMPVFDGTESNVIDGGQISFARSDDYGVTWQDVFSTAGNPSNISELTGTQLNDGLFMSAVNDDNGGRYLGYASNLQSEVISGQALPKMAVDSQGNLVLIWYDTRRDPANHNLDVFGAISRDGGLTFSNNFRVSKTSFDPNNGAFTDANGHADFYLGDSLGLAVGPDGTAYAAWTQTDSVIGNQDIAVQRFSVTAGAMLPNDRFEPNNTKATATVLGQVSLQQIFPRLTLTPGDDDWYQLTTAATGQLLVNVTVPAGGNVPQVELWDATGKLADGTAVLDGAGQLIGAAINYPSSSGHTFFLHVTGVPLGGVPENYSLVVSSLTADLGAAVHGISGGTLAAGTQDVYSVTAAVDGALVFSLTSTDTNVTLQLLSADGLTVLSTGTVVNVPITAGRTVLIKVPGSWRHGLVQFGIHESRSIRGEEFDAVFPGSGLLFGHRGRRSQR